MWSAVIADSTDSLLQVSLALPAPWASDLQPVFIHTVSMGESSGCCHFFCHTFQGPHIQHKLTRRDFRGSAFPHAAGGAGDNPGWWRGWDLMHNEMDFDQRGRGEKKPMDKLFAFLLLPADYLRCRSLYPPCGDDMEAGTANFVCGGVPLHAPSCLLSLFSCLTLLPQDYVSLPPPSPGKFACSLLSLSFLW